MSLRVALVIDGDQTGAKQALEDTASGIDKLDKAAGTAAPKVDAVGDGLALVADKGGDAAGKVEALGSAIDQASPKFGGLRDLALGAVGGIAGALASEAVGWATGAVTGAVRNYVLEVTTSGPQVERALKNQAELIERIKGAFEGAQGAASNYGTVTPSLLRFEQQQSITDLQSAFSRQQEDLLSGGFWGSNAIQAGQGPAGSPLQRLVADFRRELAEGEADVIAFRGKVTDLAETLSTDDPGRRYATAILEDTEKLAEVQAELERAKDLLAGLQGNADAAATALGGAADDYASLGTNAGNAGIGLNQAAGGIEASANAAQAAIAPLSQIDGLLASIGARGGVPQQSSAALPLELPGYAAGGATPEGPAHEIAGVVHKNEFVFDAAATARIGVDTLEALRSGSLPGYAAGGVVGAAAARPSTGLSLSNSNPLAWLLGGFSDLPGLIEGARGAVLSFFSDVEQAQAAGQSTWEAWGNAANNVLASLARKAQEMVVNGVFDLLLGALTGGLPGLGGGAGLRLGFQVGVGHEGALIGAAATTRLVDPSVFAAAPRHHTGTPALGSGEVPFIGMAGEEIGWPSDLARKYGGAGANVEIHIHPTPGQTASVEESDNNKGGRRVDIMLGEAVGKAISTPRGPAQRALAGAGALVSR